MGEYLIEDLLLTLPYRQFVWTIPKVLRVFLRHDRETFADLGRPLFGILRGFFGQAAGRSLRCAMVCSHQTFGEFGVWHPHWHTASLESTVKLDAVKQGLQQDKPGMRDQPLILESHLGQPMDAGMNLRSVLFHFIVRTFSDYHAFVNCRGYSVTRATDRPQAIQEKSRKGSQGDG